MYTNIYMDIKKIKLTVSSREKLGTKLKRIKYVCLGGFFFGGGEGVDGSISVKKSK